ncbi:hypothetical protein PS689_05306 [Pseudomonas fluorescens]|nr:hypothetical protein PS689_05306 [Pseudomonas fluorescens]
MLQAGHHHLHCDHRVIHQQSQGNDQGTEGNALHGDAAVFHEDEDQRQHQRDRAGDNQPGADAQADETDHQYDQDRFEQGAGEAADGFFDHVGLARHQVHINAQRQFGGQFLDALLQLRAERLNVSALFHGHRQTDGRLTVEAEQGRGRVGVAPLDRGQIAEAEEAVAEAQIDRQKIFLAGELAAGPDGNALRTRFHNACRRDRVLGLQALQHLTLVDPQSSQLANGKIQVDDFALRSQQFDLAQIGHAADICPYLLDVIAQLAKRQAIGREGIDAAEHITELVIERRTLNTGGQFASNVADLLAHLIPGLGNVGAAGFALEKHKQGGLTGQRVAFHVI